MFDKQFQTVPRRQRATGLRSLFAVSDHSPRVDAALLVIRVVVGAAFMFHGSTKITHPLTWMGPDPWVPSFLLALAAISEFGGGLALILGLLTPLASFGIACTMVTAIYAGAIRMGAPFVNLTGGKSWELAAAYLCIAIVLLATGPGRASLDRVIFGRR